MCSKDRVEALQKLCSSLDVTDNVEFRLDVSFGDLKSLMASSLVGLHTMWNEHFGIGKDKGQTFVILLLMRRY